MNHALAAAGIGFCVHRVDTADCQNDSTPPSIDLRVSRCDGLVALVGWDRVYEDEHWTSDVTATAALTAFISRATMHWIASHWNR